MVAVAATYIHIVVKVYKIVITFLTILDFHQALTEACLDY